LGYNLSKNKTRYARNLRRATPPGYAYGNSLAAKMVIIQTAGKEFVGCGR